jgi:hypothetical protein
MIYDALGDSAHSRVYADATNLTVGARRDLRALAELAEANTHLILFKNADEAIERNKARGLDPKTDDMADAYVNDEVMESMLVHYEEALELIPHEPYDTVTVISDYNVTERYDAGNNSGGKRDTSDIP